MVASPPTVMTPRASRSITLTASGPPGEIAQGFVIITNLAELLFSQFRIDRK